MVENAPYIINPFSLDVAGEFIIAHQAGLFKFLRAVDGAGAQDLDAEIEVALGRSTEDFIPLTPGQGIIGKSGVWRVKWAAQPGLTAKVLLSAGLDELDVEAQPTKQIVTSGSIGGTITSVAVSVGVAATLLKAANGARHALTIQNLGTDAVFVGPVGVTTATGARLLPGERFETDNVTAAFYGISATAGQDCRVLEETA